jgi:outer membrane protein OmpA-like peptidoglycan-associated protein
VKRFALIAASVVVFGGLLLVDYKGYRSLKRLEADMATLARRVDDASRLAQEESSAAAAASQRADQAAAQAEIAAGGRRQAEQQKQQAELGQAQAQSAAQQANQQAQQAAQQAQQAQDQLAQVRRERQEELNRMQEALNRVVETHRTPQGMTIVLPDSTFRFDFDSAELSQKNRELLSRIAGILLVSKGYGLSVFGYTDDVGTAEYNQQLSVRRAAAVEQYLIQTGIDKSIINLKGYGKTSPIVPGTSAAARSKNRRVEIALTDSEIKYVGEVPTTNR